MKIAIQKVRDGAILPEYQTTDAAGFDFHACLDAPLIIEPGKRVAVPTGLAMEVPVGYVLNVFARSGLALKHGLTMANGVGVIDADYRGEIAILLVNQSDGDFVIEPGMRIAQGIIMQHETAEWSEVNELTGTARDVGGFGSTGV
jgi:dUTP pyrophosphatase